MPGQTADPNQEKAIRHTVGPAQIVAGPGSGKTFVIAQRIRHLITREGVDPDRILVITFTKAAALEMQERFFRLMEPARPPVRFGTFHAVFYHILKQSADYQGYSIMTESEKRKQIRRILRMYDRFVCLQEEDLDEVTAVVSERRTAINQRSFPVQGITEEDIKFIIKEYEAYQREFRQMDFDGIMLHCLRLLTEDAVTLRLWQDQFAYILVDEFQDISPLQYEIVKLLAGPQENLFVVGDDDQSIYGFRGASPDSMRRFRKDYPHAEQILLNRNYRCHEQIVACACKVIEENHNRIGKQIKAIHDAGEGCRILYFENEEEKQIFFLQELRRRQEREGLAGCAVICRTNYDCAMWAKILRKNAIPFFMKETPGSRFRHFVIQDILAYLMLGTGDLRRQHFLRIMNRPVRYLKRDSLTESYVQEEKLLQYYYNSSMLQDRIRRLFRDIRSLQGRKLSLQVHYIRNVIGYDRYLQEKYGSMKAEELIAIAEEFQIFCGQFQSLAKMQEFILQYEKTLQEIQRQKGGEQKEDTKTEKRITLLTMHASKGLEFDTVYLPDCQEGKIPSAKSATEEEIEEERRMFYVSMTRAKRNLFLMSDKGRTGKDAPSRFLSCLRQQTGYSLSSSISSSNSAESRYSSKASATASYSSSSSI